MSTRPPQHPLTPLTMSLGLASSPTSQALLVYLAILTVGERWGTTDESAIPVVDNSPPRPMIRRPREISGVNLLKLRHILRQPLDCTTGLAAALTHFKAFLRLDCPDAMQIRYVGIADAAAERVLDMHEAAAAREERRYRSGQRRSHKQSDVGPAPFAPADFPLSKLPGSPLATTMLEEVICYIHGRSKLLAYAVRVTKDDLYLGATRQPPNLDAIRETIPAKYICAICVSPKSHPVILQTCAHSFCYVCARLAFNNSFRCPTCGVIQHQPPLPATQEEDAIDRAISPYIDWSIVMHSWDGMRFPHEPLAGLANSDDDQGSNSDENEESGE
ncbi:hypothetical protein C8F01DRAFT_1255425 [Mycena amicta]|nr:hypothetical protein C8F01DRAFT_1255425 [Mycena amicta]